MDLRNKPTSVVRTNTQQLSRWLLVALASLLSQLANAEIAVIVHPSVADTTVSVDQISNIFLGKSNKLPSGARVVPVDQEEDEDARNEFYKKVVRKDASQLNAYWSRLIFTGKGQPPKAVLDDDEVLEYIAREADAIGYISLDAVDDTVKLLMEVK